MDDKFTIYASPWLKPILDEFLERPIAPQRWSAYFSRFKRELRERAEGMGSTSKYELLCESRAAVSLVAEGPGVWLTVPTELFNPSDGADQPRARQHVKDKVRQRINNLVTKALLGNEWRHNDLIPLSEEIPSAADSPEATLARGQEVAALLAQATEQERPILALMYKGYTTTEAARTLGITPGAARQALHRLRHRIR
ncbi:MAG: hypothetical protein COA65_02415 [Rhodospirillaceae bacterium]|nr:MAG: hypothetical protein COA65_02415 [Rhodospirillaceae bacterium]